MSAKKRSVSQDLAGLLESVGFIRGKDDVFRQWNSMGDICCAVAAKEFDGSGLFTVEVGFVSPQFLKWSCIAPSQFPLPFEGNGFGIFYRLNDLGIEDGFVFPPGGWSISSPEEHQRFQGLLRGEFLPKLAGLLKELLTWNGWVRYFQAETRKFPCGRGRAWALLGYSLLASPDRPASEIEAVIEEHARQDGSKRIGNRVEIDIARQRDLLQKRESERQSKR